MPLDRRIRAEGLVNARDLGGLPLVDGGSTPFGVFARSEQPDRLSPAGWDAVRAAGIATIVDLRQQAERDRDRIRPPAVLDVRHIDHDGLEHREFWADYWDNGLVGTPLYYLPHLTALPERTAAVLSAIARAPEGGVLFHCAGGRDRTGVIAAVLLTIAGVEPDAVVDDYLESIRNAEALAIGRGRPNPEGEIDALLAARGTTSEQAFRDFLARLDVDALLALLPAGEAATLRTWRGRSPPPRMGATGRGDVLRSRRDR